jgi:hypothetical protein
MTQASRDSQLAITAAKIIFDGRDPVANVSEILVTLDHLVATVLLVTMNLDHRKAVAMLNEGLVPGVEERLALHASKGSHP